MEKGDIVSNIKVGDISIHPDLPKMVREMASCQHFCLREFVSKTRETGTVLSSLFGSSSEPIHPEEQLPPLHVPNFKWWACEYCTSMHGNSISGRAYPLHDMKRAPDLQKGESANKVMMDDSARSESVRNKEIPNPESPDGNLLNNCTTDAYALSNNGDGFIENRDGDVDPMKEKGSINNGQRTAFNQREVPGSKDKGLNKSSMKLSGFRPPELIKGAELSWKSGAENSHCKKTGKVSLVTELLGGQVNAESCNANVEQSSPVAMTLVPFEPAMVSAPKDMVSFLEDVGKSIMVSQKRKMFQGDSGKSQMNGKTAKRVRAINGKADWRSAEVICDLNEEISPITWPEIPSPFQRANLDSPKQNGMPIPGSIPNLNEVQSHSLVTNQQSKKVAEKSQSDDIPVEIVELSAGKQFEKGLPQTKNNSLIGRNELKLNPLYANVGAYRGNVPHSSNLKLQGIGMVQMQEPGFKLFGAFMPSQQKPLNGEQVSFPVPTRFGLQHGEASKPVQFPAAQSISFGQDVSQKGFSQTNHRQIHRQASLSLETGTTISDITSVDIQRHLTLENAGSSEHSTKGTGSSDPHSSHESIPARQFLPIPAFCVDTNIPQEKAFNSFNLPPRFHMDREKGIHNGSYLSHHNMNESSGVHNGVYTAGPSSQKPLTSFYSRLNFGPLVPEKNKKVSCYTCAAFWKKIYAIRVFFK